VGSATVDQLLDDDDDGLADETTLQEIIEEAEALAANKLLRAYTRDEVQTLAKLDPGLKGQVAWIALELASEHKREFISEDGKGRYWAQYERALGYLEALSKGKSKSLGEAETGPGKNTGGKLQPTSADQSRFIFAANGDDPTTGGPGIF
jgi:phage gp36-like protein